MITSSREFLLRVRSARYSAPQRCVSGFTLIELLIAVAIVSILATIAYPSYTSAVLKGRRAEGRTALTDLLQQQERYLTQYGKYKEFSEGEANTPFKTYSGDSPNGAAYKLKAAKCGDKPLTDCIQLTAIPSRADPEAGNLQVDTGGTRTCTGKNVKLCWP